MRFKDLGEKCVSGQRRRHCHALLSRSTPKGKWLGPFCTDEIWFLWMKPGRNVWGLRLARRAARSWWILLAGFAPYPNTRGKGGQTEEWEAPDRGRGANSGAETLPHTLARLSASLSASPELLSRRGPRLTTRPDRARLCLGGSSKTETGQGPPPPLLGWARQFSREREAALPPPLPISGHVTNHAGSRPRRKGRRVSDGRGKAGQSLAGEAGHG